MTKSTFAKTKAQIKSYQYYLFWGACTVAVMAGQIFVGAGYQSMSNSVNDLTELIEIKNPRQQTYRLVNIPNGVFNFGVQTFSAETHKRSKIKWAGIDIYDKFNV